MAQDPSQFLSKFVKDLEERRISTNVGFYVISKHVVSSSRIIEVYEKIKNTPHHALAVLENTDPNTLIGVIHKSRIEEYLAGLVVDFIKGRKVGV